MRWCVAVVFGAHGALEVILRGGDDALAGG